LADLSEGGLESLAERAEVRRPQANKLVFSEGDPCEGSYVTESGTVWIFKTSASRLPIHFSNCAERIQFRNDAIPSIPQAVTKVIAEARILLSYASVWLV
jgi:hypothetical protein